MSRADRAAPAAIGPCVLEAEPFGLVEVDLDGRQGRLPLRGVGHLHVGGGHLWAGDLGCWTETLRRTGVPLVVTVHQLADPEAATRARYAANLDAVLATAEAVGERDPPRPPPIVRRRWRTISLCRWT